MSWMLSFTCGNYSVLSEHLDFDRIGVSVKGAWGGTRAHAQPPWIFENCGAVNVAPLMCALHPFVAPISACRFYNEATWSMGLFARPLFPMPVQKAVAMNVETSSAKRKTSKTYGRTEATIRAMLFVGAIFTLLSPTMLSLAAFLIHERSVPGYGLLYFVMGVPQALLRSAVPTTCFVLIFWFAKDFFLERWVLYGTAWWCYSMLGVACMAATGSSDLATSALHTVLSIVTFMSSAYLVKVIYSRAVE